MSEWQPIETAPKDGTEILIFVDGHREVSHFEAGETGWPWVDYSGTSAWRIDLPTHWMPLPAPPASEG